MTTWPKTPAEEREWLYRTLKEITDHCVRYGEAAPNLSVAVDAVQRYYGGLKMNTED